MALELVADALDGLEGKVLIYLGFGVAGGDDLPGSLRRVLRGQDKAPPSAGW